MIVFNPGNATVISLFVGTLATKHQISGRESGQAAVETALTMPLTVFMIIGLLQFSLILQARLMAQYAVFRATRAGSVNSGDCQRMTDAAIASLVPTFHPFTQPGLNAAHELGISFGAHKGNQYVPGLDSGHASDIVWIYREQPIGSPAPQDRDFDLPGHLVRLEVRMIYWFPMTIPFANWVISRMMMARFDLQAYNALNPLMVTQNNAQWNLQAYPVDAVTNYMKTFDQASDFIFPIKVSYTMRMMTPTRSIYWGTQDCPLSTFPARGPPPPSPP